MPKIVGKSWKTTLLGTGAAVMNLAANGFGWKQILFSAVLQLLGRVAKDEDVHGGTRIQPTS